MSSDSWASFPSNDSFSHSSINSDEIDQFGGNWTRPVSPPPTNYSLMENFQVISDNKYMLKFISATESAILVLQINGTNEDLFEFPFNLLDNYEVRRIGPKRDALVVFYDRENGPFEVRNWTTEVTMTLTKEQLFAKFNAEENDLLNPIMINFRVGTKVYTHKFLPRHKMERIAIYGNHYAQSAKFELIHIQHKIAVEDFSRTLQEFGIQSNDLIRVVSL